MRKSASYILLTLLLSFLGASCNGDGKRKLFNLRNNHPPSLIRNHLLFSDLYTAFSFPVWFNDSLIAKNKIIKITRIIYPKSLTEAIHGDSILTMPSETMEFTFKKNGEVEKIHHTFYYDDRVIHTQEYSYPLPTHKNGFSKVQVNNKEEFIKEVKLPELTWGQETVAYYDAIKQQTDFAVFENRVSGDFLYLVSNKTLWGPLDIDLNFRPNPQDILVLGTNFSPQKIYQVENKVNETNIVQFNYKKGSIQSIKTNDYPFHSTRNFQYDKRGYCVGFIDSTFSDNRFLTRTKTNFQNNMLFSPTKIFHRKENSDGKLTLINYEEFIYEFRK